MIRSVTVSLLVFGYLAYILNINQATPDNVITFISLFIIFMFSVISMQYLTGLLSPSFLSIPNFFFISYLSFLFIPSIIYYYSNAFPFLNLYIFLTTSVLVTVPLGIFLTQKILNFSANDVIGYHRKMLVLDSYEKQIYKITLIIGLIGAVVTILFSFSIGTIPLLYLIKNPGDFVNLSVYRQHAGVESDSIFLLPFYYYRTFIFPFIVLVAFGFFLSTRYTKWRALFFFLLLVAIINSLISMEKSPIVKLIFLLFLFYFFFKNGAVSKRFIVSALSIVISVPFVLVYFITYGSDTDIIYSISNRIFYALPYLFYKYVEVSQFFSHPLYGQTIGKVANFFGMEYFNIENYVANYISNNPYISTGNANITFIGNILIDFGVLGVILGGIGVGIILSYFQIRICQKDKTVLNLSSYVVLILTFQLLVHTSLPTILASYGGIAIYFAPKIFFSLAKGPQK